MTKLPLHVHDMVIRLQDVDAVN